jgi:glycosyltransferase involved in cell wall biosynthesis
VVVETVTARYRSTTGCLADDLEKTLAALDRQTYPRDKRETIVALHPTATAEEGAEIVRRHPAVRLVTSSQDNYLAAKNAGATAAKGKIVALMDGDCIADDNWLETLVGAFRPEVGAVAGRTRYSGKSFEARTFSLPDFAYVLGDSNSAATGFNINDVAYRREVILAHPFEARLRRNGGCYLLFHQLRALGIPVLYEPRAKVSHELDFHGLGFIRKHFERGRDGVDVYRFDDGVVLKGTRLVRRAGPLAMIPIYGRRIVMDWLAMIRNRRHIGVHVAALPYFVVVAVLTRGIEFIGAMVAFAPVRRWT